MGQLSAAQQARELAQALLVGGGGIARHALGRVGQRGAVGKSARDRVAAAATIYMFNRSPSFALMAVIRARRAAARAARSLWGSALAVLGLARLEGFSVSARLRR